ncbi:MAG: glycosyltransferase family 1 protein [Candidatus Shapirobacteria bacterium]|nr:glycosyltransferase family 1 protein [Candidatus Shapirobacteria bacterium]
MVIGIDISSIPYGTGVSNYTVNLVRHLLKIDKTNTYKLFFTSFRQPLPDEVKLWQKLPQVQLYRYYFPPTFFEILWNRLHIFPLEFFIGKCDVFHTWDWTQPPAINAKTVTTVHDFVPFLFPETQHQRIISVFKRKFFWAAQVNDHFICVSQNTRQDLLHLFPQLNPQKVTIIPEAAEDKYINFYHLNPSEKKSKITKVKQLYDLKNYVLAIGTREPRKNLPRLIEAFIEYKKIHPQSVTELVIAGKYGWGDDVNHLKNPFIKILGYVPDREIAPLLAGAICLCYPSLYEGFGLPPLNALTLGVPLIISNTSSLREIAGNAAILIDPTKIIDIALALDKIITSPSFRLTLSRRGLKQSAKFSWDNTAKLTLSVYEKLCS